MHSIELFNELMNKQPMSRVGKAESRRKVFFYVGNVFIAWIEV